MSLPENFTWKITAAEVSMNDRIVLREIFNHAISGFSRVWKEALVW